MAKIKVLHDEKTCIACGACVTLCPEKWEFKEIDGELKVINHNKDLVESESDIAKRAKESENVCPTSSIGIKDEC